MLFDGLACVYSTCRDCRELMIVLDADETVHATCEPKPTKLESLAIGWRSAVMADDADAEKCTAEEIDRLDSQPPQLHRYAARYTRMGWPVFPLRPVGTRCRGGDKCQPLCQCPKEPLPGSHGFKDATTNVAEVQLRWMNSPNCNIGLATGHMFDVIDIDVRTGGVQSFLKLLEGKRLPDIHGVAVTASGGMHLYVKPAGRGNYAGVRPGIDYRGKGGYVVAPPSTLGAPGRSWSWMTVPSPAIRGDDV